MSKYSKSRTIKWSNSKKLTMSSEEIDESIKYTGDVIHICPKTGNYLSEDPKNISERAKLRHRLLGYRGSNVFLRSVKRILRYNKKLTDKQWIAVSNIFEKLHTSGPSLRDIKNSKKIISKEKLKFKKKDY